MYKKAPALKAWKTHKGCSNSQDQGWASGKFKTVGPVVRFRVEPAVKFKMLGQWSEPQDRSDVSLKSWKSLKMKKKPKWKMSWGIRLKTVR